MGFVEAALVALGVLGLALVIVSVPAMARRRGEPEAVQRARRASGRRVLASTGAALSVMAIGALVHIAAPTLEAVPFVVAPLAAASVGIAVFALMPAPTIDGAVQRRTAAGRRRELGDHLSSGQRAAFVATVALTASVVLAGGVLSKSATDGRSLCTALFPAECVAGGTTLFPGWLFAGPLLVLIAALLASTGLALRRIVDAPGATWEELATVDDELRRRGALTVLRVATTALGLTTALILGIGAAPLINARVLDTGLTDDGVAAATLAGMVALGASGVAFAFSVVMATMVVVGARRIRHRGAGREMVAS